MTEVFTNYDAYSNGKMKKLNQNQVQQARSAGRAPGPTQEDSKRLVNILQMLKMTNCLLCFSQNHTPKIII